MLLSFDSSAEEDGGGGGWLWAAPSDRSCVHCAGNGNFSTTSQTTTCWSEAAPPCTKDAQVHQEC